jgi:hypothetical protein
MDPYISGVDPVTFQASSSQTPEPELQDPVRQRQHGKKNNHSQLTKVVARKPSQSRSSRGATAPGASVVQQDGKTSEGGSKRKRASLACNTCRMRKSQVSYLASRVTGDSKQFEF